ncbi:glycosyltransferase [Niallia sp. NCCP-28]|uniref:glycosyltransferase n=1 Tax=Niallia sp. NCCP-28 TaxID=2934712 RepID=UPI00207F7783|nr:glycosyltransferase [Niallia sp. NCCP-28]GKU80700.1 hypothetical protein NCCP28_00960 [Niallia sp. NCCP-28]
MNNKKICFIYCINNDDLLQKSLKTVEKLKVPQGFQIEHVFMKDASSMTSGYNAAMKKTDAKYKVYLHQDVIFLNSDVLLNIVSIFNKYPKLGMLGVVGTKTLPEDAIWWNGECRFGKVYQSSQGTMGLLSFDKVNSDYQSVQAIDGLIMITQYDISWREDLFTAWHYYDISQCFEFIKAGYEVGIPHQDKPWVEHDCGIVSMEGFHKYRKIFIQHYQKGNKQKKQMEKNKELFEDIYSKLKQVHPNDYENKMNYAKLVSTSGWLSHPGTYVHLGTEQELHNIAIDVKYDLALFSNITIPKSKNGSTHFLHVLTTAYTTGGHTRLVERWINNRINYHEVHSVILIDQGYTEVPEWLQQAAQKTGGSFIQLPLDLNLVQRSLYLREIAKHYADYVILHIHPNDPTASVAFGKPGGPPVVYLNHADEAFWLGAGISDIVADLRKAGKDCSLLWRHVRESDILPIPLISKQKNVNINYREKYGISNDTIVLLTIASPHKFVPFENLHYKEAMIKILNKCKNAVLFVVGPDQTDAMWQDAMDKSSQIKLIKTTKNIEEFYCLGDIYVESFPIASLTSELDAALYGLPVVRSPHPIAPLLTIDHYPGMNESHSTLNSYIEYLVKLINDKEYRLSCGEKQRQEVEKKHVGEGWNQCLDSLLKKLPPYHNVGYSNSYPNEEERKKLFRYEEIRAEMQLLNGMSNIANHIFSHYPHLLKDIYIPK